MNEKNKKNISKFLSLVLRHTPEEINLTLDENGWADINELTQKCKTKNIYFTEIELDEIVETNEKKRFAFNDDKSKIRANQGHSIDIEIGLLPQEPPQILYHGTADKTVDLILESGIQKMNRQHVHLSTDIDTATKVGSRHGKPRIFNVNTAEMYKHGIQFFKSENGVWLTDFVDKKYIEII
jgi:putative RNA 2'-phosphotransferase